jgi:hypothetical protein
MSEQYREDHEPEATAEITKDSSGNPVITISPDAIGKGGQIRFDNDTGQAVYITMTASFVRAIGVPHTVKVGS